jgi:hypothetical protein
MDPPSGRARARALCMCPCVSSTGFARQRCAMPGFAHPAAIACTRILTCLHPCRGPTWLPWDEASACSVLQATLASCRSLAGAGDPTSGPSAHAIDGVILNGIRACHGTQNPRRGHTTTAPALSRSALNCRPRWHYDAGAAVARTPDPTARHWRAYELGMGEWSRRGGDFGPCSGPARPPGPSRRAGPVRGRRLGAAGRPTQAGMLRGPGGVHWVSLKGSCAPWPLHQVAAR